MSHDELSLVEEAFREKSDVVVSVGFNRRYSPLIQRVKQILKENKAPVVINYRVNAGYLSPEIWIQDLEEGGGRIISEVCHFIDLICYLASGTVKELHAVHIPPDGKAIQSEDNVIVTLVFDNGSIGVLTYTSIGGNNMEKERIEIFTKGSSLVINDFIDLQTYNCGVKDMKLKRADKGHITLIAELSKKIRNNNSTLVPFETDIAMTHLTLSVLDKIHRIKRFDK
jgi:polar amino acid transport system substrate-binding protein